MKTQYGCEQQKFQEERFICEVTSCIFKMEDNYCGKLTEIKEKEE